MSDLVGAVNTHGSPVVPSVLTPLGPTDPTASFDVARRPGPSTPGARDPDAPPAFGWTGPLRAVLAPYRLIGRVAPSE